MTRLARRSVRPKPRLVTVLGTWSVLSLVCATGGRAQGPVSGQPLTVQDQPSLTLGSIDEESPELFHDLLPPFLLPEGEIVVPVKGYSEIRVFDEEGHLLERYGGPGAGPGEFQSLGGVWARGEVIEAFDPDLMRITRFGEGQVMETVRLEARLPPLEGYPGVVQDDGWALMAVTGSGMDRRDEWSIDHYSRQGRNEGTIATVDGYLRVRSRLGVGPSALSPRAQVTVRGELLYIGDNATATIRVVDTTGRVVRSLTWEPAERPSVREAIRAVEPLAIERTPRHQREMVRARLAAQPLDGPIPAFSAFLVDDLGFVWVRPYEAQRDAAVLGGPLRPWAVGEGGDWVIFTAGGDRVGSVEVPPDLEPHHIGIDAVVGIRRDELGLEYVEIHPLHRR